MWIMTIGVMGLLFSVVFAGTLLIIYWLRPAGLFTAGPNEQAVIQVSQLAIWTYSICSVIAIIASIKVLKAVRTWHKIYLNLRAADKELERRYFSVTKTQS
jgi:hypothetical protein